MTAKRILLTNMPDNPIGDSRDTIGPAPSTIGDSTGPDSTGSATNWQTAYETTSETLTVGAGSYRSFWAVLAVLVLPLAFALEIITDSLAELDFLNSHRLWPIREHASTLSLGELATNATIWQSAIYGFMILSVPIFLWGFVVLAKQAKR